MVELRRRYPDWGARKLQVLLEREGVELTRSTIHRILLRRDLVRDGDRHDAALSASSAAAQRAVADGLQGSDRVECGRPARCR